MKVRTVRFERVFAAGNALTERNDNVDNGKREYERGSYARDERRAFEEAEYRNARKHVTEHRRTAVAHKHRRGIDVVRQKSERRSAKSRRDDRAHRVAHEYRYDEKRHGREERHAAGESVKSVYKVHRVYKQYYPEYRQGYCPCAEHVRVSEERRVFYRSADEHRRRGDAYLNEKLKQRGKIEYIVDHAEAADHNGSDDGYEKFFRYRASEDKLAAYRRDGESESYSYSAETRSRQTVKFALFVRNVDRPRLFSQQSRYGRKKERDERADRKDKQVKKILRCKYRFVHCFSPFNNYFV